MTDRTTTRLVEQECRRAELFRRAADNTRDNDESEDAS